MTAQTPAQRKAAQRKRDLAKIDFFNDNRDFILQSLKSDALRSEQIIHDALVLQNEKGCDMSRFIESHRVSYQKTNAEIIRLLAIK